MMTVLGVDPGPVRESHLSSDFKKGMARLAGGVCIVAAMHDERRYGLTITAICSLSDSPPALIACINR